MARRAEAGQVGRDAAGALEERRPQLAGVRHAVQPQDRRVAGAAAPDDRQPVELGVVGLDHARIIAAVSWPRVPTDPAPRLDAARRAGACSRCATGCGWSTAGPSAPPHRQPLDELILTVLSQSTNDRNRDVAFLRLRARFPSWTAVRDAPLEEVEAAIRPGGISKVKSERIQAILRALPDPPSLDHLGGRWTSPPRATSSCALPGVGRKTAACVLLFAFGMPDIPVDTHVSRVGTRLGLFRPGAPFEELHDDMLALTPRGQELEFHVNLLRHGRRTCHAQRPDARCDLRRMCPYVTSPNTGAMLSPRAEV